MYKLFLLLIILMINVYKTFYKAMNLRLRDEILVNHIDLHPKNLIFIL